MVVLSVFVLFSSASAQSPLDGVLSFVNESPVFIIVSQKTAEGFQNYQNYGIEAAFPKVAAFASNYEKTTGIKIAEEASLTDSYVMALTDINPLLFTFEFVSAIKVTDADKYNRFLEKWLSAWKISRSEVTNINGLKVYSLSASEIKTPLFYVQKDNYFLSSNKLEGISRALETASNPSRSFVNTVSYEQIKRKFSIDSNFYLWISGKVLSNYLNLLMNMPAFTKSAENIKFEIYSNLMKEFVHGLEFVGMKLSFNQNNIGFEFFVSVNELLSKTMKARLSLVKEGADRKIYYDGTEQGSLKLIPEQASSMVSLHVAIPPFFDEMIAQHSGPDKFFDLKKANEKAIDKFGIGLEKLVASWAGNEFFAARFEGRQFMAGAKIADEKSLEKILDVVGSKIRKLKYRRSSVKHAGVRINIAKKDVKGEDEKLFAYFSIGEYFVVANNIEKAKTIIETYNDKLPSIRASRGFVSSCEFVSGDKYKMVAYASIPKAVERMSPYFNSMLNIVEIFPEKLNLKNIGFSSRADNSGQHLKINLTY